MEREPHSALSFGGKNAKTRWPHLSVSVSFLQKRTVEGSKHLLGRPEAEWEGLLQKLASLKRF